MGLIVTLIVGLVVHAFEWVRWLMVLANEHCRVAISPRRLAPDARHRSP